MKHWVKLILSVFEYRSDLLIIGTFGGWAIGGLFSWAWNKDSLIGAFIGAFGYCLYLEYKRYKKINHY